MRRDQIVQIALATEARHARARPLPKLLHVPYIRDGRDDLFPWNPLAVAEDVCVVLLHLPRPAAWAELTVPSFPDSRHVGASGARRSRHHEMGFDPGLVVVGADVLLDLELDAVPTGSQPGWP